MSTGLEVAIGWRAKDLGASKFVGELQSKTKLFTKSFSQGLRSMSGQASKFLKGLRSIALGFAAVGIAAGLAAKRVLGAGAAFEQGITNVAAVGLQTREEIAALEEQAKRLGETTKFSATEAASAMEILRRAGFDTVQTMKAVPGVLSAAAASGLEMAEVANVVSNVLKGMNLEMDQSARVADVLALASSKTNSTIGTLGESMKNVASTAALMKVPLEDAVASVALLQDVGLDASVAGSAMNTMLTKLAKPSAAIAKQMKQMGVAFQDAKGDALPFREILGNMSQAAQEAGGNMKVVSFFADLVGLRGQKAAVQLQRLFSAGRFEELADQLGNAAGAAERMAKIRLDTLQGDLKILDSTLEGLKIDIFEQASGPLRDIVQSITTWVRENKGLILDQTERFFTFLRDDGPTILNILMRITRTAAAFAALAVAIKLAAGAMFIFNAVMAANPIGAVLTLLGLAIFFWEEWTGVLREAILIVRNFWDNMMEGIRENMPWLAKIIELLRTVMSFIPGFHFLGKAFDFIAPPEAIIGGAGPGRINEAPFAGPTSGGDTSPDLFSAGPGENMSVDITVRDETGRADVKTPRTSRGRRPRVTRVGDFQFQGN